MLGFVLVMFVYVSLSCWKIQIWPVIRFIEQAVRFLFFISIINPVFSVTSSRNHNMLICCSRNVLLLSVLKRKRRYFKYILFFGTFLFIKKLFFSVCVCVCVCVYLIGSGLLPDG